MRLGQYLNIVLGGIGVMVPWFLSGTNTISLINDEVVGLAVIALAIPPGPKTEQDGLWDRYAR